jgi:hypothetical protein
MKITFSPWIHALFDQFLDAGSVVFLSTGQQIVPVHAAF